MSLRPARLAQVLEPLGFQRTGDWVVLTVPATGALFVFNNEDRSKGTEVAALVGCQALQVLSERSVVVILSGKSCPSMRTCKAHKPSVVSWLRGDTLELRQRTGAAGPAVVRVAPLRFFRPIRSLVLA